MQLALTLRAMAYNYACADPYRAAVLKEAAYRITNGEGVQGDAKAAQPEISPLAQTETRSAPVMDLIVGRTVRE